MINLLTTQFFQSFLRFDESLISSFQRIFRFLISSVHFGQQIGGCCLLILSSLQKFLALACFVCQFVQPRLVLA